RAEIIAPDIAGDLVHGLANANLGCKVDDAVDVIEGFLHCALVANISADQDDTRRNGGCAIAVNLVDETVEDAYAVAFLEQLLGYITSAKAASAGDEYLFHVRPSAGGKYLL